MQNTVLFQTIHFCIQKQFCLNQLSFEEVRSLNFKRVIFQAIQFSIIIQFSSIWYIDRTLSDAVTLNQGGIGSDGIEEVLRIPKAPAFLEPHHQIVKCHN